MEFEEFAKKVLNGEIVVLEGTVKKDRCSGRVYVPKKFIGKRVNVIILPELELKEKEVIHENKGTNISGGRTIDVSGEMPNLAENLVRESAGSETG